MTQNLIDTFNYKNVIVIGEDFRKMLLDVIPKDNFEPIYRRLILEKWEEVIEVRHFEVKPGEDLKGCLLKKFDITFSNWEVEYFNVTKEIFLVENGMLFVFYNIERYLDESENNTFFTVSDREGSMDQTLTDREKRALEEEIIARLKGQISEENLIKSLSK